LIQLSRRARLQHCSKERPPASARARPRAASSENRPAPLPISSKPISRRKPPIRPWFYRGMLDFMILQVIGLAVVFMFPQIALWLPEKLFGP
jgi:hypothetical protein